MDELEIQGKKYISSKRAAKLTGYATDYIGQLARGGKVDATRVGRAWYVSERSILEHAGKGDVLKGKDILSVAATHIHTPQSKTVSLTSLKNRLDAHKFNTWSSVQYGLDDTDLFPRVSLRESRPTEREFVSAENIVIPVRKVRIHENDDANTSGIFDGVIPEKHVILDRVHHKTLVEGDSGHTKELVTVNSWIFMGATGGIAAILTLAIVGSAGIPHQLTIGSNQLGDAAYSFDISLVVPQITYFLYAGWTSLIAFIYWLSSSLSTFFSLGFQFFFNF